MAFHGGRFDAFDVGAATSSAIDSVVELGDGSGLSSTFNGYAGGVGGTVTASVNSFGPAIFLPGQEPLSEFFAMVVPSNDRFVGNDSPLSIGLFDSTGHFNDLDHVSDGHSIWDAETALDGSNSAAGSLAELKTVVII